MKEQIEQALSVLIGKPIWGKYKALDLDAFQFGAVLMLPNRKGEMDEVGEYRLHIQCAWRITHSHRIVVASRDRYSPAGDQDNFPEDFDWQTGENRLEERISLLFGKHREDPLVVEAIQADEVGGVTIVLNEGYVLDIFPDDSLEGEYWRFFPSIREQGKHFVVSDAGVSFD